MEASSNMRAVQIMCRHKAIGKILDPLLNIERDEIEWKKISYGGLPGGYQAAISWVFAVFCDHAPPEDWNYRDPFDSFGNMDRDIQVLAIEAIAIRHGFISVNLEDKAKGPFHSILEKMEEDLTKSEKKKNLKILK